MPKTTKTVTVTVDLDENNVPERISWDAGDATEMSSKTCRSLILALWDHNTKDTLRLDLWTKDMPVDEMKIFFHETLVTMADTLQRSVGDERIAGDMRDFCHYFAEKMDIVARKPE